MNTSLNSLNSLLKRSVKDGTLIRLKRDFYLISSKSQKIKPNTFELAALLYGPSYISLESALSFHGWIPETIPTTYSVCSKRSKTFITPIGNFSYYTIPTKIFRIGLTAFQNNTSNFFIADPWKALADFIYLKKKYWPNIIALSNDLRIEIHTMQYSNLQLLENLAENYPNKRTRLELKILFKDLIG